MPICFRFILGFLLTTVLLACSTVKKPPQIVNATANDAKLIALTNWQLRGRMAFKSEDDSFSANVRWIQSGKEFEFILTNVIGVTLLELKYKDGIANLVVDGNEDTGQDPEQLIWRVSQWQIPIWQMQRWVKGLSNIQEMTKRDDRGLLREIIPGGRLSRWQVDYTDYTQADTVVLPRQLVITRQNPITSIKFKVNKWTVS